MGQPRMGFVVAVAVCAAVMAMASGVRAQDQPAAKRHHAAADRVYAPYSKLSLSDDQKKQVAQVQAEYRAKIAALETEERQKVESLLTPEQKTQLAAMVQKMKEHRAEVAKTHREKLKSDKAAAGNSK